MASRRANASRFSPRIARVTSSRATCACTASTSPPCSICARAPAATRYGLGDLRCVAGVIPRRGDCGSRRRGARIARSRAGDDGRSGGAETIACDAVLMSVGFAPACRAARAGGRRLAIRRGPAAASAGQTTAGHVRGGPRQWRLRLRRAPPGRTRCGRGSGRACARRPRGRARA